MNAKWLVGIACFALGAFFGAAIGLLFAPMSGRELQARIRKEAEVEWQKARAEYYKNAGELQASFDRRFDEIKSQLSRVRA